MPSQIFYRLEIAPLTILPLKRSPFFTYFSRQAIEAGSLVSIPFGKQELRGIVSICQELPTRPAPWMKEVSSVIVPHCVTPEQLALAESVSRLYFTSLGKTLAHFIPDVTKLSPPEPRTTPTPKPRLPAALKRSLSPLSVPGRHALSIAPQDRDPAIAILIAARKKSKRSIVIIVPEIIGAELLSASLDRHGIDHRLLTSAQTGKQYFSAWEYARDPRSIIIGTRQALFAPFSALGTIIMVDPIDDAYKQWDMSPRYDGRRIASLLAESSGADLISIAPFATIADMKAEAAGRLTHTDLVAALPIAPIETTNLRLERYRKNYSPLSETARTRIGSALGRQKKIVVIVNQSGYSKITLCEGCKNIFRCPECQAPLHPEKAGTYACSACTHKTPLFPSCPGCGHISFRQVGFGTERVEREIRKAFTYARISRIDRTALDTRAERSALVERGLTDEADILIGVPSLLNHLSDPSISTVVFVDTDTFLTWSDFRTDERFLERVFRARLLAGGQGLVLLETFQPESAFFRKIAGETYAKILETLTDDRSALAYPPFAELAAVEVIRDSRGLADSAAEKLGKAVKALPESEKWRIFIQQAPERRFRGQHIARVLIRVKGDHFPDQLEDWFRSLPKDTFVDRDPLSLHV